MSERQWTKYSEHLLTLWQLQLASQSADHMRAAKACSFIHYSLYIMASILGTASSAALWTQVGKMLGGESSFPLTIVICSMQTVSVIVFTIVNTLSFSQKSILHRTSAYQFDTLSRNIQSQLVLDHRARGDMEVFVKTSAVQYQLINSSKPLMFLTRPGDTLPNLSLINMVVQDEPSGRVVAGPRGGSASTAVSSAQELTDLNAEPTIPVTPQQERELAAYTRALIAANPDIVGDMQASVNRLLTMADYV